MKGKTSEIWNEGSVEVLRLMWGKSNSTRQIAGALAALTGLKVTRDAVIGKAHRIGLPPHKNARNRLAQESWRTA